MPKYMYQNYFIKKKCVTLIAKCLINKYSHNQVPCFLSDHQLFPMKRQSEHEPARKLLFPLIGTPDCNFIFCYGNGILLGLSGTLALLGT